MHRHPGWIAALTCITVVSGAASAQTARTGGNVSAQLMQQMQQLASERTTLQAENDKLKRQLVDVTKDRDALKSGQQAVERRAKDASTALEHSNSQRAAVDQELTQTKAKMQELISRFRETIVQLRAAEGESTTAKQALVTRERELSRCADRNMALYKLNDEVLTHYEKQSAFARTAEIEPFTRIKRVQNENLIDDYRGRAQDQVVTPPIGLRSPSTATAPPASAAAPASAVPQAAGPEPQVSTSAPPTDH
jgi:chromosome segregation ATPase